MKRIFNIAKNICFTLFTLLSLLYLIIVIWASIYNFNFTYDGCMYSFGTTGIGSLMYNYFNSNGRWGQGISNDFRFYEYREITIAIIYLFHQIAAFVFLRIFTNKKNAVVLSIALNLTTSLIYYRFSNLYFWLPTANSYTVGFSLALILYYLIFRMLKSSDKKKKNIFLALSILVIIISSGLAELISLPIVYVLGVLLLYYIIFYKKINFRIVALFTSSLIGFLIMFFSPGNINRRSLVGKTATKTIVDEDSYNLLGLVKTIIEHLDFNIYTITLFVLSIVLFNQKSLKIKELNFLKISYIAVSLLVFISIPITLGFLSGRQGIFLLRMYNITSMHVPIVVIIFAFIISNLFNIKKLVLDKVVIVICFCALGIYFFTFYNNKTNIGKLTSNLVSNKLQEFYTQEKANRYYLIESSKNSKGIPKHENKFKGVINYIPFNKFIDNNNFFKIQSYNRVFNNGKPTLILNNYKISPNTYFGIYLVEKSKASPVYSNEQINVYFLKEFNNILIENLKKPYNFDFKLNLYHKTIFGTKTKTIYSSIEEIEIDDLEFYKDKSVFGVDIPNNTFKVELIKGRDTIVLKKPSKIEYSNVDDFKAKNGFSIMN